MDMVIQCDIMRYTVKSVSYTDWNNTPTPFEMTVDDLDSLNGLFLQ